MQTAAAGRPRISDQSGRAGISSRDTERAGQEATAAPMSRPPDAVLAASVFGIWPTMSPYPVIRDAIMVSVSISTLPEPWPQSTLAAVFLLAQHGLSSLFSGAVPDGVGLRITCCALQTEQLGWQLTLPLQHKQPKLVPGGSKDSK
jgi:hypothetical protein